MKLKYLPPFYNDSYLSFLFVSRKINISINKNNNNLTFNKEKVKKVGTKFTYSNLKYNEILK